MSVGWAQTFGLDLDQVRKALAIYIDTPVISVQALGNQLGIGVPKVESLNAWLKYLGLRDSKLRKLTPLGNLLHRYDPGLSNLGTLCVLHYLLVSNPEATIWYEAVNRFATQRTLFTRESLHEHFEAAGIGHGTSKQLKSDIGLFIRTYTGSDRRALQALGFFRLQGDTVVMERISVVPPLILGFCLFHYLESNSSESTTSIVRLLQEEARPGVIFRLELDDLRRKLAEIESKGYISVVRMADIDGISYAFQGSSFELLEAYFRSTDEATSGST